MATTTPKKLADEGLYAGVIGSQRFDTTPGDATQGKEGTLFFEVEMTLTHKQNPVSLKYEALPQPLKRRATLYLTEGTMTGKGLAPAQFRAMGWHGSDFDELEPSSKKYKALAGNKCQFLMSHEERKGKKYEQWQPYAGKTVEAKESNPMASKKLNALFRDVMKAVPAATATSAAPATESTKQSTPPVESQLEETTDGGVDDADGDEDLPF